jgi:SAM-dependent methyltransferase
MKKQYKCQLQGKESFIDSQFVTFSQTYLMNAIIDFIKGKEYLENVKSRANILDLGCYNGRVMHFLTQVWIFVNYTGVDVRKEYIQSSYIAGRKDVKLLCEDVTEGLSVADNSQDMIVSAEVLEHIDADKLPDVIQLLSNKLKPLGRMVVSFPMNTNRIQFHNLEKETNLGHVNFPVHENFIDMVESKGFKIVKFDSGFSLKSSYRIPKVIKETYEFKKVRAMLGTHIARAYAMTVDPNHTGGGYYIFDKKE